MPGAKKRPQTDAEFWARLKQQFIGFSRKYKPRNLTSEYLAASRGDPEEWILRAEPPLSEDAAKRFFDLMAGGLRRLSIRAASGALGKWLDLITQKVEYHAMIIAGNADNRKAERRTREEYRRTNPGLVDLVRDSIALCEALVREAKTEKKQRARTGELTRFGIVVEEERKRLRWDLNSVAKELRVHRATLYRYMYGMTHPEEPALKKAAEVLSKNRDHPLAAEDLKI